MENHGRWRNQWLKMSWNILGWHWVPPKTGSTKVAHWASDLPRIVPVGWGFCLVETTNGRLSLLAIAIVSLNYSRITIVGYSHLSILVITIVG
jgi:hypothetical protein